MHDLTSDGRRYQLRVDLVAANGTHYYEIYDDFRVGPAKDFRLHIGNYRGTAGRLQKYAELIRLPALWPPVLQSSCPFCFLLVFYSFCFCCS